MTYLTYLKCSSCQTEFDPHQIQTYCKTCSQPLLAVYDLERARKELKPEQFSKRPKSLWRYQEFLPVFDEHNIVTLSEGCTPLIPLTKLGERLGLKSVWVKDESQIPTGSFKARGLAMAVSKALELGIKRLAIPSAGNAAGALAAYAARAGLECFIFMPKDVPAINIVESQIMGAQVILVDGLISDCGKKVSEGKANMGWFDVSTLKEPYRLEGKKTMGLELAEQWDWHLPQVIIYPTGGGTGLIGMWKAFDELEQLGWLKSPKPRMISVQSTGCDPITRAFQANKTESEFFQNAQTIAAGLRVPKAFGDRLILRALQESHGCAISVTDEEILQAMRELASYEGIFACPEGAATWAALKRLVERKEIQSDEKVVLFNTGSGLKYPELVRLSKSS